MQLYRDSERVGPTGNITSRGVMNQLGRPQLEPLAVLVREAVQNSWDARAPGTTSITFGASGWSLTPKQQRILNDHVFADLPPEEYLPLVKHLRNNEPMHVVAIYDRGTTGLGGPTRADRPSMDGSRDFVDFLRNVGQPPDKKLAGGTYGYGKAAFYRVSHTQTICVYTRCMYQGKPQSRFIGAALGTDYRDKDGVPYTGRHWWGELDDGIAEPLVQNADTLAAHIGLRDFLGEDFGTVILILQPQLEQRDEETGSFTRTPLQAMNLIAENMLLYFWPKMLKYDAAKPSINFEVSWDHQPVPIPAPEDFPPLAGFVQAMYRLKGRQADNNFPHRKLGIRSQRPSRYLGELALQKYPAVTENRFDTGEKHSAFASLNHHTALMRQPELIVKYLAGTTSNNPGLGYYGVFITDDQVDDIFAESEPPTHDDWVAASLVDRHHKVFVNVAHTRIIEQMDLFAKPAEVRTSQRQLTPLGAFSNSLGSSLLSTVPGGAATTPFSKQYTAPRPSSLTNKASLQQPSAPLGRNGGNSSSQSGGEGPSLFARLRAFVQGTAPNESQSPASVPVQSVPLPPAPSFIPPSEVSSKTSDSGGDRPATTEQPSNILPKRTKKPLGQSRVRTTSGGEFVEVDGQAALKVSFTVEHGKNAIGTQVLVRARAVIDGGSLESDPPVGGSQSEIIRWVGPDDTIYAGSPELFVSAQSGDAQQIWAVVLSLPDDMMIAVEFDAAARGEDDYN
ncbi:MAG: hypothetical protein OHK0046_36870 [Anaerolineae bacterium]